jgi:hypothetical protein
MTNADTGHASATPGAVESDARASEWDGIPAELLFSLRGYDTDSAGGCG